MMIFHPRAAITQQPNSFGDMAIPCGYQTTVAVGAQVLPGVETETADVAEAPRPSTGINRAVRLSSVFYYH